MNNRKLVLVFTLVVCITSCTINTHYLEYNASTYSPTDPAKVQIFTSDIDRAYKVIGSIAVATDGNNNRVKLYLKEKAAELGADAVIEVNLTKMSSSDSYIGLSGVAVKYE